MGSDNKGKGITETIVEETKAVAVEVYKDAARPAVSQVGKTLELAVEVTLAIPNMILGGAKAGLDKLSAAITKKLGGVPDERLLPAPATIAAQAALHYLLLGESDKVAKLREMFENLLVTSMDRDTAAGAHPAFVSMIPQLTPDEAWILKSMSIDRTDYALASVRAMRAGDRERLGFRTTLGSELGFDVARQQQCISNLVRLGILSFGDSDAIARFSNSTASDFQAQHGMLKQALDVEFSDDDAFIEIGSIEVTPLGRQFLDACVRPRVR